MSKTGLRNVGILWYFLTLAASGMLPNRWFIPVAIFLLLVALAVVTWLVYNLGRMKDRM